MTFFEKNTVSTSIIARVFVALVGGFLLANLVAILISYLSPDNKIDGLVAGMMVSFIVYTAAVMYVFAANTARSAALYVFGLCLIGFSAIYVIETVYIL